METDSRFQHLRSLAAGDAAAVDETTLPPEAYEAWRAAGMRFGKFIPLGELGRGGTSVVYRAWQADLRREVALKVVSGLNPELRDRFLREARVGAKLSHAAILPVFEAGEDEGSLWLAMPLVRGKTLDECGLDARGAAQALSAAARGIAAAHAAGVIHRDLKPRNIMRTDAGEVVVMDFGLAFTREESTRISVTGQVLGTPQYMAPEQAAGRAADARTDVYGLGVTLYRLLAGRAPYPASTLQEFLKAIAESDPEPPSRAAQVPADLEAVVLKAMEREPSRRYAGPADFADDLDRFLAGAPVLARRGGTLPRLLRRISRNRRAFFPIAALLVSAAAYGTGTVVTRLRTHRPDPQWEGPASLPADIQAARALVGEGQLDRALAAYGAILAADPRRDDAWLGQAECHITRYEWTLAADDFRHYLDLKPTDSAILRKRAECLLQAGDTDAAMADANRALDLRPGHADFLFLRSEIHFRKGEPDAAIADQDEALRSNPDHPYLRARRGDMYIKVGRAAEALPDLDFAIQKGGRHPEWLMSRGRAKRAAGDRKGAIADLLEAMSLDSKLVAEAGPEVEAIQAEMRPPAK